MKKCKIPGDTGVKFGLKVPFTHWRLHRILFPLTQGIGHWPETNIIYYDIFDTSEVLQRDTVDEIKMSCPVSLLPLKQSR